MRSQNQVVDNLGTQLRIIQTRLDEALSELQTSKDFCSNFREALDSSEKERDRLQVMVNQLQTALKTAPLRREDPVVSPPRVRKRARQQRATSPEICASESATEESPMTDNLPEVIVTEAEVHAPPPGIQIDSTIVEATPIDVDLEDDTASVPVSAPTAAPSRKSSDRGATRCLEADDGFTLVTRQSSRFPPITLTDYGNWSVLREELVRVTTGKMVVKAFGSELKIHLFNSDDYRAVSRVLEEKHIKHVVFPINRESLLRVIFKRIADDVDLQEVRAQLASKGFEIRRIVRLPKAKEAKGCALVLVHLPNDDRNKQVYEVTEISGLQVLVVPFEKRKRVIQCFNCQKFGHGASACHLPTKCVKCGLGHASRDCTRPKTRQATCANCGGPHPASFRNCRAFPKVEGSTAKVPPNVTEVSYPSLKVRPTTQVSTAPTSVPKSYAQAAAAPKGGTTSAPALDKLMSIMNQNHLMMMRSIQEILLARHG